MGNEMQTLNERIAERVGKELVDLMPEGDWQKLVDAQLQSFKQGKAPKLIDEMLAERLKVSVSAELDKYCRSDEWNNLVNLGTSKAVTELISQNGAQILAGILSPVMTQAVQDFKQRMGYY